MLICNEGWPLTGPGGNELDTIALPTWESGTRQTEFSYPNNKGDEFENTALPI